MSIKLLLTFANMGELLEFASKHKIVNADLVDEVEPKKEEKRGNKIKELHENAKTYRLLNPEQSYKDCLKVCGIEMKKQSGKL